MDAPAYSVTYLLAANVTVLNNHCLHVLYVPETALKMAIGFIILVITGLFPNSQKNRHMYENWDYPSSGHFDAK